MYSIVPRQLSFTTLRALVLAVCAGGMLVACGDALDSAGDTINNGGGGNGTIGGGGGTTSSGGGGGQTSYTIGGKVAGLLGAGLVLANNAGDILPIASNGIFNFSNRAAAGATYAVTVFTQPTNPSQVCTVANGTGTVASANVITVAVTCTSNLYSVGGTLTGLNGTGLVLQDNGGANLTVTANGTFTFVTQVASNQPYAVTVSTQPSGPAQLCRVTNGTGTVTTANITTVSINCLNTGKYLFVANTFDNGGNGSIAAFTINPASGALTAATGSPYTPTENRPYNLAVDPSGLYLYVTDSNSALISTDAIGAGGALTLDVSTATTGAATNFPYGLAIDPTGPYVFVGSDVAGGNGTLEAYAANAGVLTPVTGALGTSTYPSGNVPYQLVVDPVNALLFAANYFDGNIVGYSIGGGGQLTAVPGSPFPFQAGLPTNQAYAMAVYPKGGFLYITDSVANSVDLYSYAANGTLGQWVIYEVGAAPKGVTIDPTGSFLYVSNSGDGTVSGFTINATTGELTAIAGSPFVAAGTASPNSPTAVQVDPSGQFAYVGNGDAGTLSVFSINIMTGALTVVGAPVSSIITDGGPNAIAIE
jgi:6-phosphogluconolactonase (cycloisomerase 2 family)